VSSVSPIGPAPRGQQIGRVSTVAQVTDEAATAAPPQPEAPPQPDIFRAAVSSLAATAVRAEVRIESLRAPQKLAPYSYALSAEVLDAEGLDLASGRLVLLHDPDGHEAWDGVLRLVAYASAELDEQMGVDPMLPSVGWSWLTGALDERGAAYRAAGGTVTQTTSTRFGDLVGPSTTVAMELRASWTADTAELAPHLQAFVDLLCTAAGLPPEGVTILSAP
jgi:DUF3000 family protein